MIATVILICVCVGVGGGWGVGVWGRDSGEVVLVSATSESVYQLG